MTVRIWIDPPNGWRYGFPKVIPVQTKANGEDAIKAWLLNNGYPQHEIDNGGMRYKSWSDMRKTRLDRLIEKLSSNV